MSLTLWVFKRYFSTFIWSYVCHLHELKQQGNVLVQEIWLIIKNLPGVNFKWLLKIPQSLQSQFLFFLLNHTVIWNTIYGHDAVWHGMKLYGLRKRAFQCLNLLSCFFEFGSFSSYRNVCLVKNFVMLYVVSHYTNIFNAGTANTCAHVYNNPGETIIFGQPCSLPYTSVSKYNCAFLSCQNKTRK